MAPTQSSSGMRFLRLVSYSRCSHGASLISTSVSERSYRSSSSATLAAANRASASVQPLSVVLERKPWIRDLSLPRPARSGCAVMEACAKGADYGGNKYDMDSSAQQASIPAPFLGSIFNRLLAATRQALGQRGLEVFSARIAGTVDKRPNLLLGPIARADTRCRVREMTEGFLNQRGFRIIATTIE